nr:E3 ubiquitin-protein ligase UPL5 [Tanacetum cinerariifolium]
MSFTEFFHPQRTKRKFDDYDDDITYIHKNTNNYSNPNFSHSDNEIISDHHFIHPITRQHESLASTSANFDLSSDRIQFFVRMISGGKTLVLYGKKDDTVKLIHEKIQAVTGIPLIEQRLIYRGRQLQWESSLAECSIKNDAGLHLVGRMRSTEHPKVWQVIDGLVNTIYRMCKGEIGGCVKSVKCRLDEFLDMMKKNENENGDFNAVTLNTELSIFQSLCVPLALVMLYMSPHKGNKERAAESIRHFIDSSTSMLPKHIYSQCGNVVLDFCKFLSRAATQDDPLYIYCRSNLGSMVEDVIFGRCLRNRDTCSNRSSGVITVEDIFPFVRELANKLSEGLGSGNGSPSPSDVRDFAAFLRPIRVAIKDLPEYGGYILKPMMFNLSRYSDEIKILYMLFLELMDKIQNCMEKIEGELVREPKTDGGWDQYLSILKELHSIAKLYEGLEDSFWSSIKAVKVSFRYLIARYAKRGEDCKWIIEHKDLLDFESRRHLAMMFLPEMNDEYEELHEMLIDRSKLLAHSYEYFAHADSEKLRGGLFMEFTNEEATGPGVLREWFFLVCQEIFNPQNALFVACPNDRRRFFPNPASKVDPLHLKYFKFAGRVIALALMHKVQVGIVFDRAFFLQLAGSGISLEDIKDADPYLYSSCKQILDMDPSVVDQDVLGLTFAREIEELGCIKVVELFADGKNIVVNSRNREEYVELLIQHSFVTSVSEQVTQFVEGFEDIVRGPKTRKLFFKSLALEDLDGMLHGSESSMSVEDWKAHTEYNGYKETDDQIDWFWKIVGEMTAKQQQNMFPCLPINGCYARTLEHHHSRACWLQLWNLTYVSSVRSGMNSWQVTYGVNKTSKAFAPVLPH